MRQRLFQSSGDLGDIIASLAAVKHLGGGAYRLVDRPWTKALIPRAHLIEPLLRSQSYISDVVVGDDPHGRDEAATARYSLHDFSTFRSGGLPWGHTLGAIQAKWIGVNPAEADWRAPWVSLEPAKGYHDKVVFHRSPRYNNHTFPWPQLAEFFDGKSIFLGLPDEHATFEKYVGRKVPRVASKDLLEAGTIIKGSALFVGNQSSPFNIAEAMKHPRVLEVCLWTPDCCYGGGDVIYCSNGDMELRDPTDPSRVLSTPAWVPPRELDTSVTPNGGWLYTMPTGDMVKGLTFDQAKMLIAQRYRDLRIKTPDNIGQELIDQTIDRLPGTGMPRWYLDHLATCEKIKQLTMRYHIYAIHLPTSATATPAR